MKESTLLEAVLGEERLNRKFISLLLACHEQRVFACQTPTMAKETVVEINMRLRAVILRSTDLLILKIFIMQCPDEIFVENCVFWISECLKVSGNQKIEDTSYDIIKMCLKISSNIEDLTRPISQNVIPKLLDKLLETQKPTYSALQCLQILFHYYSESCKEKLKSLQMYLLNIVDEEDKKLVEYAGHCMCYLPLITENSDIQGSSWTDLVSKLCVTANSVLFQLFVNVPETVIPSSLGEITEGVHLKPIEFNDPILLTQSLARRLLNLLIFIEGMLGQVSDCVKQVRADLIITLASRGLSISCNMLKNSSTMWHIALMSAFPVIQTQLLKLLKTFVSCCKGVLKFGPLFCRIAIKTLKVTSSSQSDGMEQPYSQIRKAVYNFLENWILRAKAASYVELFDEELISLILHDISQGKDQISDLIQGLYKQHTRVQDHCQQIHPKPIFTTCEAALKALCAIVLTSGSQLAPSVHIKLQDFVVSRLLEVQQSCGPEDMPVPFSVPECRLQLYQLLQILTLHPHPQTSPPTNYAFSFFPKGQQDTSPEVVKFCTIAMASTQKMFRPSRFSQPPISPLENSDTLLHFTMRNIINEKKCEEQNIQHLHTRFPKSIKTLKKRKNALSVKAPKRSSHSPNSGILQKKKRVSEGSIESLNNAKTLQSTDKGWFVKNLSKRRSRETEPKNKKQEVYRAVNLQNITKGRRRNQTRPVIKRSEVKYHSTLCDEVDISEETTLVDLVSEDEIPLSRKTWHRYARNTTSCEDLITVYDIESSDNENYVSVVVEMEISATDDDNDDEKRNQILSNTKEIGTGIREKEKNTYQDMKNICNIENDANIGANEEIRNDTEKITKEGNRIEEHVMMDEENSPSMAQGAENECQVQSLVGESLMEMNSTADPLQESVAETNIEILYNDNRSNEVSPNVLETEIIEKVQLQTEISSFVEQPPSTKLLTENMFDTDSSTLDNSENLTSITHQMLQQDVVIKEMPSLQKSNLTLNMINEINRLEEEHTYVVKSLSNLSLQNENVQMKNDNGSSGLKIKEAVNADKVCPLGASNEAIPLVTVEEGKQIQIIDEAIARKQDEPEMNKEKVASNDSEQGPPLCKESIKNELETHGIDMNKVDLLDKSTEVRNCQIKGSDNNGTKGNDIVCTRKKEYSDNVNEGKIVLLAESVEVTDLEAERGGMNIHVLDTALIGTEESSKNIGKEITALSNTPCIEMQMSNDDEVSIQKESPANVNASNSVLSAESDKVTDLESERDGNNTKMLGTELIGTKEDVTNVDKENTTLSNSLCIETQDRDSIITSVIRDDGEISESKENAAFLDNDMTFIGKKHVEKELPME